MLKDEIENLVAARRATRVTQNDTASQAEAKLRQAVATMGSAGECGLRRVAAMSRVAVLSLETPDGFRTTESLAEVLRQIGFVAQETLECLVSEADAVGCMERDEGRQRRQDAAFAEINRLASLKAREGVSMSV